MRATLTSLFLIPAVLIAFTSKSAVLAKIDKDAGKKCANSTAEMRRSVSGDPSCICERNWRDFARTYQGNRSTTVNGYPCLKWKDILEKGQEWSGKKGSSCRGYGYSRSRHLGPWCYFKFDPKYKQYLYEPCFKVCEDDGKSRQCYFRDDLPTSIAYTGKKDTAADGRRCEKWDSSKPPEAPGLLLSDRFCRSDWQVEFWLEQEFLPNLKSAAMRTELQASFDFNELRPFCMVSYQKDQIESLQPAFCHPICDDALDSIGCIPPERTHLVYKGPRSLTASQRHCQAWTYSTSPHDWSSEGSHNQCRNPEKLSIGPYCLVSNKAMIAEPCFATCDAQLDRYKRCVGSDKMADYLGTLSTTLSNKTCLHWMEQPGVKEKYNADSFGVKYLWMASNFCRNPNASIGGPWCFVKQPASSAGPAGKSVTIAERCFWPCDDPRNPVSPPSVQEMGLDQDSIERLKKPEGPDAFMQFLHQMGPTGLFLLVFFVVCLIFVSCIICQHCCLRCSIRCLNSRNVFRETRHELMVSMPGTYLNKKTGKVEIYTATDAEEKAYVQALAAYFELKTLMEMENVNVEILLGEGADLEEAVLKRRK